MGIVLEKDFLVIGSLSACYQLAIIISKQAAVFGALVKNDLLLLFGCQSITSTKKSLATNQQGRASIKRPNV